MNNRQELHYWPLDRCRPYDRNARIHDPDQIERLATSLLELGWGSPIQVRGESEVIIAGHARAAAARLLIERGHAKFNTVPVVVHWGLSDLQFSALAIADNRIAELASWDNELLELDLRELRDADFDITLSGFSLDELSLQFDFGTEGETDPDELPTLSSSTVTTRGDIWLMGNHSLMCGDSTSSDDVSQLLDGRVPTIMITDPPYGVAYSPEWRADAGINGNDGKLGSVLNDTRADWREAWALFPGHVAYVWHAGKFASTVQASLEANDFEIRSQIIWSKERFALSRGDYHWQHEPCWYAVRRGRPSGWLGSRKESTVWEIKARESSGLGHGTQKPVECMKRPIENSTILSAMIYDPFVGSGTTIIAAEMTGRWCLAMELSPEYVDIAVRRWQAFTGRQATLASGETFDAVAVSRANDVAD